MGEKLQSSGGAKNDWLTLGMKGEGSGRLERDGMMGGKGDWRRAERGCEVVGNVWGWGAER